MNEFRKRILKVNKSRRHKVTNSIGVKDAYNYIKKNNKDIIKSFTSHEFYYIIRNINKYLADNLSNGEDIILPHRLGRLEVRKYSSNITIKNGKIKTNLPIDWNRTLKLWEEDKESYKNKTLIKMEEKTIFKIHYNRMTAKYKNKAFYKFNVNRRIKLKLRDNIKEGIIESFSI